MKGDKTCSSFLAESGMYGHCRDGFMQTPACHGEFGFYFPLPECCDEDRCGKKYEQWGGKPPEHLLTPRG